jgi:hypothetical protein
VAAFPGMLEHDRKQAGWSVGRAAWELGVSIQEYRELEAGSRSPNFETPGPGSASSPAADVRWRCPRRTLAAGSVTGSGAFSRI